MLALGIGASVAIFAFVDAALHQASSLHATPPVWCDVTESSRNLSARQPLLS